MRNRGVIYYNTGTSCLVRLLVSLHSLRRHYQGPVCIVSEGESSHDICRKIGAALNASVLEWESKVSEGRNHAYLAKTRLAEASPFATTIALDSDTLVLGEVESLFPVAEEHLFCVAQFSNWRTDGRIYSRRIREWAPWLSADIGPALQLGPAINIGLMAFRKDASIFAEWGEVAVKGRHLFIPDEISCQILLHRHSHHILPSLWNCSCKYDDPSREGVRLVHYHGRKHCRIGLPFHGKLWVDEFEEVLRLNLGEVAQWMPAGDRLLRRHLRSKRIEAKTKGKANAQFLPVYHTPLWSRRGHFNEAQADKFSALCKSVNPRYALEIGFCTGRSAACVLHQAGSRLQKMISVDKDLSYRPPGRKMAEMLMREFKSFRVMEASSHELLTPAFLRREFPEGLDFVLVDGDHSYDGCARDLVAVSPFMNGNGVIVVDDYGSGPPHGVRFDGVTSAVDDFLSVQSEIFAGESWNHEGKGFCIIRRMRQIPPFGVVREHAAVPAMAD